MIVYDLTPGLQAFIVQKHPQISQWPSRNYQAYKSLCQQIKVRSHPNSAGAARPHATWKYKHMLRKMIVHLKHKRLEELVQPLYYRVQHLFSHSLQLAVEQYG